jgi:hypothetical protein
VIAVSSTEERGVDELAAKVGAHADHRRASGSGSDRLERWRWEIVKRAETRISQASRQLSADQLGPATSRSDRVRALLEEALAGSGRPGLRSGRP